MKEEKTICDLCGEELQDGYHFRTRQIGWSYLHSFWSSNPQEENFDMCVKCLELIHRERKNLPLKKIAGKI